MEQDNKEMQAVLELRGALDQKFGQDIMVMDLRGITTIADFFVIATGGSAPQLHALAETTEEIMAKHEIPVHHIEGIHAGQWILLDYGVVIVHLFDKENRQFYQLERVWGDANII